MKAQPLKATTEPIGYAPCEPSEATHIRLHLPGPLPNRILPVSSGGWTWNGSTEAPTVRPSVLTRGGGRVWRQGKHVEQVCHSWITDGKVQFLDDCTHEFAGQTLDLLEVD